jgi:hypothetical protein
MRGLLAALPVVLFGSGCIYLDEPNYAPTITAQATSSGPYYRGEPITVAVVVGDRNPADVAKLAVTWLLTDGNGAALPAGVTTPCDSGDPGCFVPHRLGDYLMTTSVVDERGASSSATTRFTVENRDPVAALDVVGSTWPEDGHYRLLAPIRFSPLPSSDPDADDLCALTYDFPLPEARPLQSRAQLVPCADPDIRQGCGTVPTMCLAPDAAGTWRIRLNVADPAGATATTTVEVEVDGDHPPCLRQFTPEPVERLFVSRADPALVLAANVVEDDLDPYPPVDPNAPGPTFAWSLQLPGEAGLVAVPDYDRNYYTLDQSAFSVGDEVTVRLDVADRAHPAPDCSGAVCPPGLDPVTGCVQRVTWALEVY